MMTKQFCKLNEIIKIGFNNNPFLITFLDDSLSLEDAKKLYDLYEEELLPKSTEVGIHITTNRRMIYLFKTKKVVYEDNIEEEVPFVQIDKENRGIRVKDQRGLVTEFSLLNVSELLCKKEKGIADSLLKIKEAFLNCKIKVIDDAVYVSELIVYVFLCLIKNNKSKKSIIKLHSRQYDKNTLRVFFSIYRNLKVVCQDDLLASISCGSINVKRNGNYNNAKFLFKRCELI